MPRLLIELTEEQYQHIQEERNYGGRTMLTEECMGGFSLTLNVGVPDISTHLEMRFINNIDLGEVTIQQMRLLTQDLTSMARR